MRMDEPRKASDPTSRNQRPAAMPTSSWECRPDPRARRVSWLPPAVLVLAISVAGVPARAEDPPRAVNDLLRLAPPDASLVLTVEGLRDQFRSINGSGLLASLRQLPAVKSWLDSEKHRHLRRSCEEVEAVLGVKLAEIRDEVLGDAVVLVLRLPPGEAPDPSQARGLLLLRAHDPALLERLISSLNAAQRDSGELKRVDARRRGNTTYHVREFPDGSGRPPECYVGYPDGTFAFSNSEELIQGVVDRKPPVPGRSRGGPSEAAKAPAGPGLGETPRMIAVRRRLPEQPLACLYLDPRAAERLLSLAPRPAKPGDARFLEMLRRHLSAVDYAGAALVWRPDAIVVHAVETLDAPRADAWLRRWAGDARPCRPALRRVPRTALAMACLHVDLTALREAVYEVVPEADHQRLRNFEVLLTGLLLGHDVIQILPVLGPGMVAYLDEPAEPTPAKADSPPGRGSLFPLVVVVDLATGNGGPAPDAGRGGPSLAIVADSLENALRTVLTVVAMDEKHGRGRAAIATSPAAVASVMTLNIPIPFACAIDRAGGRLVLGTSAASVARYLESSSDPDAGARFRDWQAAAFPGYETFVCVDLDALTRLAGRYRGRLASKLAARQDRPVSEVETDLHHVLALARLFRAAFVASRIEPDASALHRCLGVILKDSRDRSGP